MDERQQAFKKAMQLQFEQHPSLLRLYYFPTVLFFTTFFRTLLDTNDALLVSCARFSSTEGELNSGMRERDLRSWLSVVRVDTKKLIDTFLLPMAFRPPYFGGNRLGLILMELRREFILKVGKLKKIEIFFYFSGCFPATLARIEHSSRRYSRLRISYGEFCTAL